MYWKRSRIPTREHFARLDYFMLFCRTYLSYIVYLLAKKKIRVTGEYQMHTNELERFNDSKILYLLWKTVDWIILNYHIAFRVCMAFGKKYIIYNSTTTTTTVYRFDRINLFTCIFIDDHHANIPLGGVTDSSNWCGYSTSSYSPNAGGPLGGGGYAAYPDATGTAAMDVAPSASEFVLIFSYGYSFAEFSIST